MSRTTRHQATTCPSCGEALDASTAVSDPDATPEAGDISLCIQCATPLEYGPGLVLRPFTKETWAKLDADTVIQIKSYIAGIKRHHGK